MEGKTTGRKGIVRQVNHKNWRGGVADHFAIFLCFDTKRHDLCKDGTFCPVLAVNKPLKPYKLFFGKSKEKANVSPTKKNRGEFAFVPNGGEGGIRTLAAVSRPTPLAGVSLRPA